MADVAARAGVSKKTVSAVVNGVGQVSTGTSERVRAAIDDLGFLPNPLARSLISGRAGVITLAVPHLASGDLAVVASAVIAAAERAGVGVVVEPTGGDPERESDVLRPGAGITDGVLLVPSGSTVAVQPRVPVVVIGDRVLGPAQSISGREFDHVVAPAGAAILKAAEVAGTQGRLAVVVADADSDLLPDGLEPTVLRTTDGSAGAGFRAVTQCCEVFETGRGSQGGISRVVAVGGGLAIGAVHALATLGIDVPAHVRLAAVGGGAEAAYADPEITTVAPDIARMAELAVDRLLARINGSDSAVRFDEVPLVIASRASTGS